MIRFIRLHLLLALVGAIAACGDSTAPAPERHVASVTVVTPTQTLFVGDAITASARPHASDGSLLQGKAITWSSSNPGVLQLSVTGVATAVTPGTATIRATVEGKTGSVDVMVNIVPVAQVRVPEPAISIVRGESRVLVASTVDAAGRVLEGRTITWQSNDVTVATIDATGRLAARHEGTTTVIAESEGKTATVEVNVARATAGSVVITPAATVLEVGRTRQLTAIVLGVNGDTLTDRGVVWSVDNQSAAGITGTGLLWGIAPGYVTITATSEGRTGAVAATIVNGEPDVLSSDLLYHRTTTDAWGEIMVLGTTGGVAPIRLNAGSVSRMPTASPNGRRIAFYVSMQELGTNRQIDDIYAVDRDGMNMKQLTTEAGIDAEPAWSPTGDRIAYRHRDPAAGRSAIWVMNADGSNKVKLTADLEATHDVSWPSWSPDGSRIAFATVVPMGTTSAIWTMNADGSNQAQRTSSVNGYDTQPTWSADGTRIAFSRNYSGDREIAILSLDAGTTQRIALPGAQWKPAWSPDGRHIAFWQPAGTSLTGVYTMRPDGSNVRLHTADANWGGGYDPSWIRRP